MQRYMWRYTEMFSNCDFSYSSETANSRNTIAFKRLAYTDYFRTANQNAVRERHKRNGYANLQRKRVKDTKNVHGNVHGRTP